MVLDHFYERVDESLQSHGDVGTSGSTVSNIQPFENKEIQVVMFPSAKQLLAHLSTAYIIAFCLHTYLLLNLPAAYLHNSVFSCLLLA